MRLLVEVEVVVACAVTEAYPPRATRAKRKLRMMVRGGEEPTLVGDASHSPYLSMGGALEDLEILFGSGTPSEISSHVGNNCLFGNIVTLRERWHRDDSILLH